MASGWIASKLVALFTISARNELGATKFDEFAPAVVLNFNDTLQSAPTVYVPEAVERTTPPVL